MRVRLRLIERDDGLGSETGVRAAVQAHSGELYGFAYRALGDQGLAEDVVQETFVRAWRAGVGHAAIPEGDSSKVVITLDAPVTTGAYAVLRT